MSDHDNSSEIFLFPITNETTHLDKFTKTRVVEEEHRGSKAWLVSFTDVMALMLTFFVLLFGMSKPEDKPWSEVSTALQNEFNRFYGPKFNRGLQNTININKVEFNKALDLNYLKSIIEGLIAENPILEDVNIIPQSDHLILSLPQDLLFDSGDVVVKESGLRVIYALGGTLSRIRNQIEVIGHADPSSVNENGNKYSNNWSLSLARAANVAGLLYSVGYDKELIIRGLSSGRFEDLENVMQSREEKLSFSRRVDLIIRNTDNTKRKVFFNLSLP